MTIQLIAGLGNTGSTYDRTRHNAGVWFAQALAEHYNISFRHDAKCKGSVALLPHASGETRIFIPQGFMNHSGTPIRLITQFYKIPPEAVLIAHDELDLPLGRIKLKTGGGHGGHNGLRDIISQLQSPLFHRLRIGIGHPGHRDRVHDYVLNAPSAADKNTISEAIAQCLPAMPDVLSGKISTAMNAINTET